MKECNKSSKTSILSRGLRDQFCNMCGSQFSSLIVGEGIYPRECEGCGSVVYSTPSAVAVVLVPVRLNSGQMSVLCVRRVTKPENGICLPGGFVSGINKGGSMPSRSCFAQALEEVFEETGIRLNPSTVKELLSVGPTEHGAILHFYISAEISEVHLPPFVDNDETSERLFVTDVSLSPLCFSTHNELARWLLKTGGQGDPLQFSELLDSYRKLGLNTGSWGEI